MPRRFNSAAIWRADGKCASSVKIGFMRSASSSAGLLLASLPDVQPPSVWPRALAALRPSLVREEISERSFCASAPKQAAKVVWRGGSKPERPAYRKLGHEHSRATHGRRATHWCRPQRVTGVLPCCLGFQASTKRVHLSFTPNETKAHSQRIKVIPPEKRWGRKWCRNSVSSRNGTADPSSPNRRHFGHGLCPTRWSDAGLKTTCSLATRLRSFSRWCPRRPQLPRTILKARTASCRGATLGSRRSAEASQRPAPMSFSQADALASSARFCISHVTFLIHHPPVACQRNLQPSRPDSDGIHQCSASADSRAFYRPSDGSPA
jgi:hypothetical protein